ncbi:hypothetical protein V6N12_029804 [Hibiscus sabdariffa]|uniref:Uncharacterized protein n=1 Tax=Hibiscus sabdariffa TaxID=183260 RepID=A0ABR2CXZ4_9ROSI
MGDQLNIFCALVPWRKRQCNVIFDVHFVENEDLLRRTCRLALEFKVNNEVYKVRRRREPRIGTSKMGCWKRPPRGWFKENVDETCCLQNNEATVEVFLEMIKVLGIGVLRRV